MPLPAQALLWDIKREALVPISIDIDVDGVRLIDSFTWDLHQGQLSPEQFSKRMIEELGLSRGFILPVAQSISRQLLDFRSAMPSWRSDGTVAAAEENLQLIDIDIRFRSIIYRDRMQWDVNCLNNSPEVFARCTVADLGLPQEMEAPIAYSVHQQLCKHRMTGSRSSTEDSRQISEDRLGPYISSVQPVDQYEFKSRDWSDHRPLSKPTH
ncbi:unnamed protein product [Ascophyllum nodosum]